MPKRKVKKRKLKIIPFIIIILVLLILGVLLKLYLDRPIQNIVINGTKYINDDYILEQANLKDYPSFFKTFSFNVEKQLKKSIYIKDVKVRKKLFRTINIKVKENRPLFYDNYNNKTVFENHKSTNQDELIYNFNIPRLVNYIPKEKYNDFIDGMNKINDDILVKISDIEYKRTDLDDERFLLYMNDGNEVYITITKFDKINYYNDVVVQLEGHKGILYLDNGNHFEIKK